ncbi:MAG: 6-phosphogluconolactonase [Candidatus Riflebacteria bacterium]
MTETHLKVSQTHHDFDEEAATQIMKSLRRFANRDALIGLSGGKTPLPVYEKLAAAMKISDEFAGFYFIQVDERNVANNSPRSNQHEILKSMFGQKGLPARHFCMIKPGNHDFAEQIKHVMPGLPAELQPPRPIDLLILGVGQDGHTASLFPDEKWQKAESKTGYQIFSPKSQPEQRISLTLERILQARHLVFLVSGTDKNDALTRALIKKDRSIPAGLIVAERPTEWILAPETVQNWPGSADFFATEM